LSDPAAALSADFLHLQWFDLPAAQPERYAQEIAGIIGCDPSDILKVSAKTGEGVEGLLNKIVDVVPPPAGELDAPARALIFDSVYDTYRGVVTYVRVVDGRLTRRERSLMMSTASAHETLEVGVISPEPIPSEGLAAGEVGYLITGVKDVRQARVGDTVTSSAHPAAEALAGYSHPKPMVFSGLYPVDGDDYPDLRDALDKLRLNDAALVFEPETSDALGFGFRCGFLGLLHLEIIQERLQREFDLDLITTAPSVVYRVHLTNGRLLDLHNPADMPDPVKIESIEEPWIKATILVPDEHVGSILKLCEDRRGVQQELTYVGSRAMLIYRLPLNEVVFDFYDRLKSVSRGYASFDYHLDGYETGDLVKLTILVNGEGVDALGMIVHRSQAEARGRGLCARLKELIPRQLFKIAIQAAIGGKVIARETVSALRKDVTAKCYGGDATRKRKLLEKQKEGKKKMRQYGNVEIPQSAFIAALKIDGDR